MKKIFPYILIVLLAINIFAPFSIINKGGGPMLASLIAQAADKWYFVDGNNVVQGPYAGSYAECVAVARNFPAGFTSDCYKEGGGPAPVPHSDNPQCADGIDNDSDGFIDKEDPDCHTDNNPKNQSSYLETNIEGNIYHFLAPLKCDAGTPGCVDGQLKTFNASQRNALGTYLNIMIKILIGVAAVLAVIMIVMGGIQYMTSELVSSKEEGKKRITNALIGLLIALGAYILLYTINPNLLKIEPNADVFTDVTLNYVEGNSLTPILTSTGELANAYPNVPVVAYVKTSLDWNQFVTYAKTLIGKYPKENVAMGLAIVANESNYGVKGVNNNYAGVQADVGRWRGLPVPPTATTVTMDRVQNRRFVVWGASDGYKASIELPTLKSKERNMLTSKDYLLKWVGQNENNIKQSDINNFNSILIKVTRQLGP